MIVNLPQITLCENAGRDNVDYTLPDDTLMLFHRP